ncbi:MAG: hypothetical protein V4712_03970 [Pseudomonadota bacterium]
MIILLALFALGTVVFLVGAGASGKRVKKNASITGKRQRPHAGNGFVFDIFLSLFLSIALGIAVSSFLQVEETWFISESEVEAVTTRLGIRAALFAFPVLFVVMLGLRAKKALSRKGS